MQSGPLHGASQETARGVDAARNSASKGAASLELQEQPAFLSAGKLRGYQLEGLNWLTYAWLKVGWGWGGDGSLMMKLTCASGWLLHHKAVTNLCFEG